MGVFHEVFQARGVQTPKVHCLLGVFSPMVSSESVETVTENEASMISPRDLCVPMLLLSSSVAIDPLLCVDDHVADVAKF